MVNVDIGGGSSTSSYWNYAKQVESLTGWNAEFVYAQWQLETANFTSPNFRLNNNIAGQTWTSKMPLSMRGTARPSNEGGYYIRYNNPVEGYVDFITNNSRYNNVRSGKTAEQQAQLVAKDGWAVDPQYAQKLISIIQRNRKQGYSSYGVQGAFFDDKYATADASKWITGDTEGLESTFLGRLAKLAEDYKKKINITSGYRTIEEQTALWNKSDKSGKWVASPGNSRHNVAVASDIGDSWVKSLSNEQLAKYGLYKPMSYENWHVEAIETKGKSTAEVRNMLNGGTFFESGIQGAMKTPKDELGLPLSLNYNLDDAGAFGLFERIERITDIQETDSNNPIEIIKNAIGNTKAVSIRMIIVLVGIIVLVFALQQALKVQITSGVGEAKEVLAGGEE